MYVYQKHLGRSRTSQELSKSIFKKNGYSTRFLTIAISHLGKWKKPELNSIFDNPLTVNQAFSQIEFIIGKSEFAHIMHFQ